MAIFNVGEPKKDMLAGIPVEGSDETAVSVMDPASMEPAAKIDDDFHGWLLGQASALRQRRYFSLDWDHLAEELEEMAAANRRELLRRLTTLLEHLLKLQYQPAEVPRRGRSWRLTVRRNRIEIKRILAESPGLKGRLVELVSEVYLDARANAGTAAGLNRHQWEQLYPSDNPWMIDEALADDLFPA